MAICVAIVSYASIRANKLRNQINSLEVFTLKVQAIDQKTRHPTDSITVLGPYLNVGADQIMMFRSAAATASNAIRLEYIGTPPFSGTVSVTNAGYQQKIVSFDSTNCQLSVYLTPKT